MKASQNTCNGFFFADEFQIKLHLKTHWDRIIFKAFWQLLYCNI